MQKKTKNTKSTKIKQDTVLAAIKGSCGVVSTVAKRLGVEWHTAKKLIERNKKTIDAFANEEEGILDLAENQLFKSVRKGDMWACKFLLATKGKKRGYSEKVEVEATKKTEDEVIIIGAEEEAIED